MEQFFYLSRSNLDLKEISLQYTLLFFTNALTHKHMFLLQFVKI